MSKDTKAVELLNEHFDDLVKAVVDRHFELHPELADRYKNQAKMRCLEDARNHLCYLSTALSVGQGFIFSNYIVWANDVLSSRGIPTSDLRVHLEQLCEVLKERLPEDVSSVLTEYVNEASQQLDHPRTTTAPFLSNSGLLGELAQEYFELLIAYRRDEAVNLLLDAVKGGVAVGRVYRHVLEPAQKEIGRLWQMNKLSVAQEHYCTAVTELAMAQLCRIGTLRKSRPEVVLVSSVLGERHDIGARMVSDFLEIDGWRTIFLGASTPHEALAQTAVAMQVDLLALSATLSCNIDSVSDAILVARKASPFLLVMVGGPAFEEQPYLWEYVSADAYAPDASAAIAVADNLVAGTGNQRSLA